MTSDGLVITLGLLLRISSACGRSIVDTVTQLSRVYEVLIATLAIVESFCEVAFFSDSHPATDEDLDGSYTFYMDADPQLTNLF